MKHHSSTRTFLTFGLLYALLMASPAIGNIFLRGRPGMVAAASCIPLLSGFAIGSDFAMGLCDVTTDADVTALSSQQTSPDPNYFPEYTAGKRMSNVVFTTLTSDPTAANGKRFLKLGAITSGTPWQNITAPFPIDTYPNVWVRMVMRNIALDVPFGLDSGSDFFEGLLFAVSSTDHKLYTWAQPTGSTNVTAALTPALSSTDLVEVMIHVHGLTSSIDTGVSPNVKTDSATWDVYVRVNKSSELSATGITGTVRRHPISNVNANGFGSWELSLMAQQPGGNTEVHAWEFVDGSLHTDPFGV